MILVRLLIHISPIIILSNGMHYGAIAAALFVFICYVKVKKLQGQAEEATTESDINSITKAMERWRQLTFLPKGKKG